MKSYSSSTKTTSSAVPVSSSTIIVADIDVSGPSGSADAGATGGTNDEAGRILLGMGRSADFHPWHRRLTVRDPGVLAGARTVSPTPEHFSQWMDLNE